MTNTLVTSSMLYIDSPSHEPQFNLALEEYLFYHPEVFGDVFMLWQNAPSVIVGRYQNAMQEVDAAYVETHSVSVVRRMTGGGAVYHDLGNLNYSILSSADDESGLSFEKFTRPVIAALSSFGVDAAFTGRNDLTIDGKKFCGNAQYLLENRLLHHGCIMLSTDLTAVERALCVGETKLRSKAIASVRSRVTTINNHTPASVSMQAFKDALLQEMSKAYEVSPYTLTGEDMTAARKLRDEKYYSWEWNVGETPPFDVKRELRFSGGALSVYLQTQNMRIQNVKFYGDFFGGEDIAALERALRGRRLDDTLETFLQDLRVERYVYGLTAHELYALLTGK